MHDGVPLGHGPALHLLIVMPFTFVGYQEQFFP